MVSFDSTDAVSSGICDGEAASKEHMGSSLVSLFLETTEPVVVPYTAERWRGLERWQGSPRWRAYRAAAAAAEVAAP